ncbi:MAG: 3-dehydroquinate synthase [Nitrospinales bacterium]
MKRLKIDLGDRSYEILIAQNLLAQAGEYLSRLFRPQSRVVVITQPSINRLYGEILVTSLQMAGFRTKTIEVPEGEQYKSLQEAEKIFDQLLDFSCDRQSVLVAFGGGVIGDLTGFVAATFMRGVPFVQVPTTLLSQVDSSVGGKTAVNHPKGKNLIGVFYQPRLVLIDLDTLKTLRVGMAEVIKYGVIKDAALFDYLGIHAERILALDTDRLGHIIETSCAIKAKVVELDEKETNYRRILNFGHTIGHAIETLTSYTAFKHGECVAVGMVYAGKLSQETGHCSEDVSRRIYSLVKRFGLPTDLPDLSTDEIIEAMRLDKKAADQKIMFVLVKEIGQIEFVKNISETTLKKVLEN